MIERWIDRERERERKCFKEKEERKTRQRGSENMCIAGWSFTYREVYAKQLCKSANERKGNVSVICSTGGPDGVLVCLFVCFPRPSSSLARRRHRRRPFLQMLQRTQTHTHTHTHTRTHNDTHTQTMEGDVKRREREREKQQGNETTPRYGRAHFSSSPLDGSSLVV